MVSAAVCCRLRVLQSLNSVALTLVMCRVDLFIIVRGCGAIAQWLEHWRAKREALGSIPSYDA